MFKHGQLNHKHFLKIKSEIYSEINHKHFSINNCEYVQCGICLICLYSNCFVRFNPQSFFAVNMYRYRKSTQKNIKCANKFRNVQLLYSYLQFVLVYRVARDRGTGSSMCYFSVLIPQYHIHGLFVLNSPSVFLNCIAPIDNLFLFIEGPVTDGEGHLCVISPC